MTAVASRAPGQQAVDSVFDARLQTFVDENAALLDAPRWEAATIPTDALIGALGAVGIFEACRSSVPANRELALSRAVRLHRRLAHVGNGAAGAPVLSHLEVSLRLMDGLPIPPELPEAVAAGRAVVALAATEPTGGSDLTSLRTRVHAGDAGLVVTGEKLMVSNAACADHFLVLVDDPDQLTGPRAGSALVIVDHDPGQRVRVEPIESAGHPGLTGRIVLDRAPVRAVALPAGRALLVLMRHWIHERVMLSVRMAALAESVLAGAVADVTRTTTFGASLIGSQHVQFRLAELQASVQGLDALAQQGVRLLVDGRCSSAYAAACKHRASQVLRRVADESLQLAGGSGYQTGHRAERILRDSAGLALAGGTEELMLIQLDRNAR